MMRTIYVYRHDYADSLGKRRCYTLTRTAKRLAAREHAERCGNRVTS